MRPMQILVYSLLVSSAPEQSYELHARWFYYRAGLRHVNAGRLVLSAVSHGSATMGAGVFELTGLEEVDHGGLAIRALHGFDITVSDKALGSWALSCCLHPNSFAFIAGDGI